MERPVGIINKEQRQFGSAVDLKLQTDRLMDRQNDRQASSYFVLQITLYHNLKTTARITNRPKKIFITKIIRKIYIRSLSQDVCIVNNNYQLIISAAEILKIVIICSCTFPNKQCMQ